MLFRRYLMCVAIALLAACQTVNHKSSEGLDSPEKLLRQILQHAKEENYDAIRPLVYPAPAYPGLTMQDAAIAVMKEKRPLTYTGDFSYSNEALEIIIQSHLSRFTDDFPPRWLRPAAKGGMLDDRILEETKGDPSYFRFFDHMGCHILLVRLEGSYRLIFWEGMNHFLK